MREPKFLVADELLQIEVRHDGMCRLFILLPLIATTREIVLDNSIGGEQIDSGAIA